MTSKPLPPRVYNLPYDTDNTKEAQAKRQKSALATPSDTERHTQAIQDATKVLSRIADILHTISEDLREAKTFTQRGQSNGT